MIAKKPYITYKHTFKVIKTLCGYLDCLHYSYLNGYCPIYLLYRFIAFFQLKPYNGGFKTLPQFMPILIELLIDLTITTLVKGLKGFIQWFN